MSPALRLVVHVPVGEWRIRAQAEKLGTLMPDVEVWVCTYRARQLVSSYRWADGQRERMLGREPMFYVAIDGPLPSVQCFGNTYTGPLAALPTEAGALVAWVIAARLTGQP